VIAILNNVAEIHSDFRNDETTRQCSERVLFQKTLKNFQIKWLKNLTVYVLSNVIQRLLFETCRIIVALAAFFDNTSNYNPKNRT
jgi:hypothetical protein